LLHNKIKAKALATIDKANITKADQLEQWSTKAVVSLSASLVFGRERASEIAQPLLMALFSLTANDYKKALGVVVNIDDFSVKRIFLEQFKHSYILNAGSEDLSILIAKVDFSNRQMSDKYDAALLKLFNENNKSTALLSQSLRALPITSKRLALKRLSSGEFDNFKKVKITTKKFEIVQKQLLSGTREPVIRTWVWVLIFIVLATLAVGYIA
jgi:hypothetical protein